MEHCTHRRTPYVPPVVSVRQVEVNKTAFAGEGDETRGKLLGLDVGSYVRIEFTEVPAELVRNFQVRVPVYACVCCLCVEY